MAANLAKEFDVFNEQLADTGDRASRSFEPNPPVDSQPRIKWLRPKVSATGEASLARPFWPELAAFLGLLLILAALRPLAVPDEGRYAEVGRWMLQSGDWLTPRLNGVPFFHKPPLLHWLQAGAMALFGVHSWTARLIPALNAGMMLIALYLSVRKVVDEAVARRAAVMLGSSLSFLLGGQYFNHDMLVANWIGIGIWCFALSMLPADQPHAGLARLGFVACALGVLSKGLIGVVLPGLVVFAWLVWTRQLRKTLKLPWLSGLALFALIAAPWFIFVDSHYPGLFDYQFGTQQISRYTGAGFNNARPWWFYASALGVLMFPWAFWALAQAGSARRVAPAVDPRMVALCWCWLLVIVGFFSIPNSKLVGYALPVMPPLALLAALGWDRTMAARRWSDRVFVILVVLALSIAVAINTLAERATRHKLATDIAPTLACGLQSGDTIYAVGGYPYDLPFLVQLRRPMVVVQDWPALRESAGDGWQRELFEGGDFDADAARVLQTPDVLVRASRIAGHWLVAPKDYADDAFAGWAQIQRGSGWVLYRSTPPGAQPLVTCTDFRAHIG
jgi:4-amino-4-deoxy-L-arabinose transferase-like glycosyltransferase